MSFDDPGITVYGPYTKQDGSTAEGSYHLSLQIQDSKLQITVDGVQVEGRQNDNLSLERLGQALTASLVDACKGASSRVTFDYLEFGGGTLRLKVRR